MRIDWENEIHTEQRVKCTQVGGETITVLYLQPYCPIAVESALKIVGSNEEKEEKKRKKNIEDKNTSKREVQIHC